MSRRRLVRPGTIAVALVLVLAAAVAAVVARDDDRDLRRVRAAPALVLGDGPVRLELTLALVDDGGATRSVTSTAEVDDAHGRAHTRLAEVIGPGDLELVAQGSVLYLSVPAGRQEALGARWLRVSADSVAAARGAGIGSLPDPLTVLRALEGASGDVERGATRRGLTLHRFTTSVRSLADRGGDDAVAWAEVLAPLGPTLAGEAYLDDDGRPRRVRLKSDLGARGTIVAVLDVEPIVEGLSVGIPPDDATLGVETITEALRLVTGP